MVCLLFLMSGACGLVYQQLWLRQLSLVFGVTIHAVTTVLASFFGGLALGSFVAGRWISRTSRPLRWYGISEVVVGLLALVTTVELRGVQRLYVAVAREMNDSPGGLVVVRAVLSFAVLIVPATLLGATLPLLSASSVVRRARGGERLSVLYATNTAGAILGVLAAGFWLIGSIGIGRSFQIAGAVNIAVGVVAIAVSTRWDDEVAQANDETRSVELAPARNDRVTGWARRLLLVAFGISGFVSIALEVVWFRTLAFYVESTTYAFTALLAAVLLGIALGGYVAAELLRRCGARLWHVVVLEVAIAFAAVTSFELLSTSFRVSNRYGEALLAGAQDIQFVFVAGALTVLPTSLLLGIAFPIGLSLWSAASSQGAPTARAVGTFYAVNVAAGVAGSLAAGFVLVPGLGTRATLVVLCTMVLGSALALGWAVPSSRELRSIVCGTVAVAFAAVCILALPDPYSAALTHRYPQQLALWHEEGAQTTVSIHELTDGTRVMYLDGLPQASNGPETVAYHRLIGALALAVHADPQRALVVGLGGGVTAGALSVDPGLEVDVVELSPEVVEGARWLADVNGDVVDRPNVEVLIDDGRNFLLTTEQRYDVITADLIQPRHAGAGKLWSAEYWTLARRALAPGGVMVQWVPAARARDHSMIVRSFLRVFPYVTSWADGTLLVGSNEQLHISAGSYEQRLVGAGTGTALTAAGLGTVDQLRALYTAGRDELDDYAGPGPVLTDDRPRLEFWRSTRDDRDQPPDLTTLHGEADEVIGA